MTELNGSRAISWESEGDFYTPPTPLQPYTLIIVVFEEQGVRESGEVPGTPLSPDTQRMGTNAWHQEDTNLPTASLAANRRSRFSER